MAVAGVERVEPASGWVAGQVVGQAQPEPAAERVHLRQADGRVRRVRPRSDEPQAERLALVPLEVLEWTESLADLTAVPVLAASSPGGA